jgi:hypothetical protein
MMYSDFPALTNCQLAGNNRLLTVEEGSYMAWRGPSFLLPSNTSEIKKPHF